MPAIFKFKPILWTFWNVNITFIFQPVPSVLWAPKHWGSQWEDTGGPQKPDPRGGNQKSLQGKCVSLWSGPHVWTSRRYLSTLLVILPAIVLIAWKSLTLQLAMQMLTTLCRSQVVSWSLWQSWLHWWVISKTTRSTVKCACHNKLYHLVISWIALAT